MALVGLSRSELNEFSKTLIPYNYNKCQLFINHIITTLPHCLLLLGFDVTNAMITNHCPMRSGSSIPRSDYYLFWLRLLVASDSLISSPCFRFSARRLSSDAGSKPPSLGQQTALHPCSGSYHLRRKLTCPQCGLFL